MNTKSVKSVSPNNKFLKKFLAVVLSIMVFIVSFIIITNSNNAAKDTIDVVRVKNKDGLTADTAISEDDLEVYKVIRREYKEDMYRGDELEQLVGKYPNYYLRTETIIHKDQLTDEKLQKNEWLYAMENDREAVTIPYDYIEWGGDILTPGDRIRVRAVYESDEDENISYVQPGVPDYNTYDDPYAAEGDPYASMSDPYAPSYSTGSSAGKMKTEIVFDEIVVKDMLNSKSHSIYEIYKEVTKLPEDRKQAVMKTEDFIQSILPKALVLEATPEQVHTYSLMKGNNAELVITILTRNGSNIVLDDLSTLQSEVETWIEKNQ